MAIHFFATDLSSGLKCYNCQQNCQNVENHEVEMCNKNVNYCISLTLDGGEVRGGGGREGGRGKCGAESENARGVNMKAATNSARVYCYAVKFHV